MTGEPIPIMISEVSLGTALRIAAWSASIAARRSAERLARYWSGVVGFITAKGFPGASLRLAGAGLRREQLMRATAGQGSSLARRRPAAALAPEVSATLSERRAPGRRHRCGARRRPAAARAPKFSATLPERGSSGWRWRFWAVVKGHLEQIPNEVLTVENRFFRFPSGSLTQGGPGAC